jgi:hypothetical protein
MFVRAHGRYGMVLTRGPVPRPHDRSGMTYACPGCDVIFDDGVAYSTCPACDLPLDWVRLDRPVWCCAGCDRMINDELEQEPYCDRCGRSMTRIDLSPAWPAAPVEADTDPCVLRPRRFPTLSRALESVGAAARCAGVLALTALLYGLCGLALFGPILSMALDPGWRLLAMATCAPVLLVPLILGVAVACNLIGILGELRDLARDRATRVIHGLEHATVKVLAERGFEPEGGITHQGFFRLSFSAYASAIFDEAGIIHGAARDAIDRVSRGEADLAFHRRCGTSILVASALVSLMAIASTAVALFLTVDGRLLVLGLAGFALLMALGARRLGILVQRLLTVSTDFRSAGLLHVIRHMEEDGNTVHYDVLLDVDVGDGKIVK